MKVSGGAGAQVAASGVSIFFACMLAACGSTGSSPSAQPEVPETAKVEDLYIVDCLLPGQVRRLGNRTYLTPRRPTRTTAQDCRIRGGEYVAYDRADYKTALKVWLPAAEAGEADAQNAVGEIFEQGLGTEPNYDLAFVWYQRAAEQGHKAAQVNLATLYETGRGVEQDKTAALNWYRRAWGIGEDELIHRSEAERELVAQARQTAAAQDAAREAGEAAAAAQTALDEARERLAAARREASAARGEAGAAREREAELAREVEETRRVVEGLKEVLDEPDVITRDGRTYGRYFALVIGNADYVHLNKLETPVEDTRRLSEVLTRRYGFQVRRVSNADNTEILRALNALNDVLREDDNLLIYYSGHGNRRESGSYDAGYWLPVNAEPPPNDTFWVPTEQVTGHLARLKARRIMVVADSAFAGLLSDNPAFLLASDPAQLNGDPYIDLRLPNRSRLLMTSGVDAPLPRLRASFTSVFADAFIEALEENDGVATAPALFLDLLDELAVRQPELDPEFKAIRRAGDEVGDFFFVAGE
jgi:uncharacterized caspase-like protein